MPNVECRMKRGEWERESGKNQSHLRTQPSAHAELRQKYEREPLNGQLPCLPSPPALSQVCDSSGCLTFDGWEREPKRRVKWEE